ncbi:MAG: hypothetical protein CL924_02790, partial [Deltaproteobacteria bacterium]
WARLVGAPWPKGCASKLPVKQRNVTDQIHKRICHASISVDNKMNENYQDYRTSKLFSFHVLNIVIWLLSQISQY